jgi:hypothetical protein
LQNQEVFATDVWWLVFKDHGFYSCDFQLDLLGWPVIVKLAGSVDSRCLDAGFGDAGSLYLRTEVKDRDSVLGGKL